MASAICCSVRFIAHTLTHSTDSTKVRPRSGVRGPEYYNRSMQKKIFWMLFALLGLLADFLLPLWWGVAATIPILFIAWWVAYRSDWF